MNPTVLMCLLQHYQWPIAAWLCVLRGFCTTFYTDYPSSATWPGLMERYFRPLVLPVQFNQSQHLLHSTFRWILSMCSSHLHVALLYRSTHGVDFVNDTCKQSGMSIKAPWSYPPKYSSLFVAWLILRQPKKPNYLRWPDQENGFYITCYIQIDIGRPPTPSSAVGSLEFQ